MEKLHLTDYLNKYGKDETIQRVRTEDNRNIFNAKRYVEQFIKDNPSVQVRKISLDA